jgi:hypothetical protein
MDLDVRMKVIALGALFVIVSYSINYSLSDNCFRFSISKKDLTNFAMVPQNS